MHVEKGDAIAFVESAAVDIEQRTANLAQPSHRDVAGNQRIRNTFESALLQVHICPADF